MLDFVLLDKATARVLLIGGSLVAALEHGWICVVLVVLVHGECVILTTAKTLISATQIFLMDQIMFAAVLLFAVAAASTALLAVALVIQAARDAEAEAKALLAVKEAEVKAMQAQTRDLEGTVVAMQAQTRVLKVTVGEMERALADLGEREHVIFVPEDTENPTVCVFWGDNCFVVEHKDLAELLEIHAKKPSNITEKLIGVMSNQ